MKRIAFFVLLFTVHSYGQNCGFEIDKEKIVTNSDLDYFLNKLATDEFEITNTTESIPEHLSEQLDCLADGFSIANPNEEFQSSDIIDPNRKLAERGLVFLAKSETILILYYGMSAGPGISSKFLFLDFDSKGIKKLWCGNGIGIGLNMNTLEDVANRIKLYRGRTPGLQSGIMVF